MPTVLHRLAKWADESPASPGQKFKKAGVWETITVRDYMDRVYYLALFLESRGITSRDVGCIFSPNCAQWTHLDLATLLIGARSAGIYPNSIGKDIEYILNHTEARVLGIANQEFYAKFQLPPRVELVIMFDGDASVNPKAVSYEKALAEGRKIANSGKARSLKDYLDHLDPKAGQYMIYTSGTTGSPKGALLSHDNFTYTADIISDFWGLPQGGSLFSFLPLCHVAEKIQSIGVGISRRYTVSFATKFENVAQELPEVEPTLLLCVPRLWEKMMEGVMNKVARGTGAKKQMAVWAMGVGARVAAARYGKRFPNPLDLIQYAVADKLVLSKIRKALGLGHAEALASGAAALPAHVSRWFRSIGLEILEDFGQTESTGVICGTERGVESAGTVGKPVPGTEFKIADDGEILSRGRHVFVGYFKDEASTASTLDQEGWLHTGDLGEITDQGLVRIRGRKKEILKTSGGKMIAPLPIEEALKAAPIISQVCMVGDGRKYLAALITLSEGKLIELQSQGGKVLTGITVADAKVVSEVKQHVDALNKELPSYEQIKRFSVLAKEFSIADGEMTPTLKMKRNVIETRYKDVIDQMYTGGE